MPGKTPRPPPCARPTRSCYSIPRSANVVGTLEPYRTVTGYCVTPVVALIPPELKLVAHEHEVAERFEAPLGLPARRRQSPPPKRTVRWKERHYYEMIVERTQDLGGDRGNHRQSLAPAAMD